MRLPVLISILAAVLLAGCGDLPRPFKPSGFKESVDLRALAYDSTVMVMPPEGDIPADPLPITEALRDALLAEGLIATTWNEAEGGLLLTGQAGIEPLDETRDSLSIDWSIDGPGGRLARYRQERALPAGAWQSSNPQALVEIAGEAAAALVPQLYGPPVEEALVPGFPGARLVIQPVTGAPGDGNEALAEALRIALRRADLPLAEVPGQRDLAIRGTVDVRPAGPGQEEVAIVWRLEDPQGEELGKISQANAMQAGSLDDHWGSIAVLVARGAADGLSDLLDRLARQRAAG